MSINIQAKTNYSFLFSGLSSTASNAASSNWLADYASIKNGSYAKLMKAYYGKENTASKTAASDLSLIHISEPTRPAIVSRMPSSA